MKHIAKGLAFFFLVILAACASPAKKEEGAVYFPPELPRIKFLTHITGSKDMGTTQSAFDKFVIGEEHGSRLDKPYGLAVYKGKIYVADTNSNVLVLDLEKKTLTPLAGSKDMGKLLQPINITIDSEGYKYVADSVRQQVVIFDSNDRYVNAVGLPGQWKPVDVATYEDRLYVADLKNALIKVFDKKTGEFLKEFGQKGKEGENLSKPTNIAIDHKGFLRVADDGRFQIVKYDRDGHYVGALGKIGANPAHFARPRGISFDRDDRMYVVDAAFNNVQIFDNEDRLLLYFGKGGVRPGDLYLPAKVLIDYDNLQYFQKYADPDFDLEYLVFVTNQFERRLVNVFGFGKVKGMHYPTDAEMKKQLEDKIRRMIMEEKQRSGGTEKTDESGKEGVIEKDFLK